MGHLAIVNTWPMMESDIPTYPIVLALVYNFLIGFIRRRADRVSPPVHIRLFLARFSLATFSVLMAAFNWYITIYVCGH